MEKETAVVVAEGESEDAVLDKYFDRMDAWIVERLDNLYLLRWGAETTAKADCQEKYDYLANHYAILVPPPSAGAGETVP